MSEKSIDQMARYRSEIAVLRKALRDIIDHPERAPDIARAALDWRPA